MIDPITEFILKEANERTADLNQLKSDVKKFCSYQYRYCSKKVIQKLAPHKLSKNQINLEVKRMCPDAVAAALLKQKKVCKQAGGFMSKQRLQCQEMFNNLIDKYWAEGDKYGKKYKLKYKK